MEKLQFSFVGEGMNLRCGRIKYIYFLRQGFWIESMILISMLWFKTILKKKKLYKLLSLKVLTEIPTAGFFLQEDLPNFFEDTKHYFLIMEATWSQGSF